MDTIEKAGALGAVAFKIGIKCLPHLDAQLIAECGESKPILKAWIHAWIKASIGH